MKTSGTERQITKKSRISTASRPFKAFNKWLQLKSTPNWTLGTTKVLKIKSGKGIITESTSENTTPSVVESSIVTTKNMLFLRRANRVKNGSSNQG